MKMWLPMQAGDRAGVCLWMSSCGCTACYLGLGCVWIIASNCVDWEGGDPDPITKIFYYLDLFI